jgi:hypothetical protein
MATDKYPNRNVEIPYGDAALAAARARLVPKGYQEIQPSQPQPADGKGSRREVRKGEWIDDRVFKPNAPPTPSQDSPPELPKKRDVRLPTFADDKFYSVSLGQSVIVDGRALAPGKEYLMAGYVCTPISSSIVDAVEMGDIPVSPPVDPSIAKKAK